MQINKFPPNEVFLLFSILMMLLVMAANKLLDKTLLRLNSSSFFSAVFKEYEYHSLTIFLYQTFAFNITVRVINKLIEGTGIFIIFLKIFLCLISVLVISASISAIAGRLENFR